jgi:hypothetical protein
MSAKIKLIVPVAIIEPPMRSTTSLGEGGKTFSTKAKRKSVV